MDIVGGVVVVVVFVVGGGAVVFGLVHLLISLNAI